ncbi:MAG: hypothetical protein L3K26_10665 [Candidatus Hydrogenedentes bacterium]|nr:hypothetical protein [Candidatus Hydrogenedentota bacterium]
MKHLNLLARKPNRAEDFSTGQKLALAAGISEALSSFYAAKETPPATNTTVR